MSERVMDHDFERIAAENRYLRAEATQLREALRELYDGAVAKGPSCIPAFKKARQLLGDTPDE
jgi:hypothetical protein